MCTTLGEIQLSNDVMLESVVTDVEPSPCEIGKGTTSVVPIKLHSNHSHQLLHSRCALVERGLLFRRELDLNDLLDPLRA